MTETGAPLQPLTHVPYAVHTHSGQYDCIGNPPQPSVTSMVSPGTLLSTSVPNSTPPTMGGTLHLQPLVGYIPQSNDQHKPPATAGYPTSTDLATVERT